MNATVIKQAIAALLTSLGKSLLNIAIDLGHGAWGFLTTTRLGQVILGLGISWLVMLANEDLGHDLMSVVLILTGLRYGAHRLKVRFASKKRRGQKSWWL